MRRARNTQLLRHLRLLSALRHWRRMPALAEEFGVSQRTMRRDLVVLRIAGLVVRKYDEGVKVYRIDFDTRCPVCNGLARATVEACQR